MDPPKGVFLGGYDLHMVLGEDAKIGRLESYKPKPALQFVQLSNDEAKPGYNKSVKLYQERICIECLEKGESHYLHTKVWRHLKDEDGKVIHKDRDGNDVWLCNKHGLMQRNRLCPIDAKVYGEEKKHVKSLVVVFDYKTS